MNSAAVIGRQLRQQNPPKPSGGALVPPPTPKFRPRTPSHAPAPLLPGQTSLYPPGPPTVKQKEQPPSGCAAMRSRVSCRCIWHTCKALSLGLLLCAIGTAMSVVGFYALPLSTELVRDGNRTIERVDEARQMHLYNLTYVGPVMLGLGGFALVAACVMSLDYNETHARVSPMGDEKRPSTCDMLLLEVPMGNHLSGFLDVPSFTSTTTSTLTTTPFFMGPPVKPKIQDKGGGAPKNTPPQSLSNNFHKKTVVEVEVTTHNHIPPSPPLNGPRTRDKRPDLSLPPPKSSKPSLRNSKRKSNSLLSPNLEELMPSPQDVVLLDPDGCGDTPLQERPIYSSFLHKYHNAIRIAPRYLASMETLSDSESIVSAQDPQTSLDLEDEVQRVPLLGRRCSPPSPDFSPDMFRRECKRFPLLRQSALDGLVNNIS